MQIIDLFSAVAQANIGNQDPLKIAILDLNAIYGGWESHAAYKAVDPTAIAPDDVEIVAHDHPQYEVGLTCVGRHREKDGSTRYHLWYMQQNFSDDLNRDHQVFDTIRMSILTNNHGTVTEVEL